MLQWNRFNSVAVPHVDQKCYSLCVSLKFYEKRDFEKDPMDITSSSFL